MLEHPARGRRARPVWTSVCALGLAAALWQLTSDAPASPRTLAQDGRPNVIVIMTDDQTVESVRVMRNVQRLLASQGTTFVNSFASFPLCCPSRATFLTGQYSHNHGVVGNNFANGLGRLDQSNTLPVWLSRAGYTTIFVGKYLNEYGVLDPREIPPGWDEWYAGLKLIYFRHTMNRNGRVVKYGGGAASYQTDVYTRTAVGALRRHMRSAKPFFLWLSYFAPHQSGRTPTPAPRHRGAFANDPLPRTPAFDEEDVFDKPLDVRRRTILTPDEISRLRTNYQRRLESLLAVDEGIGEIVATLRSAGELRRTVIIFTSDNGFLLGEHRLINAKEQVYEPSIRVPLIVRGPQVPRGIRVEQPVVNADVAPTIVQLAGATAGRTFDGRSLLPLFADAQLEWGRDILLERGPGASVVGDRIFTAIRTPRYVYAEYSTGERELYDLAADPDELQNRRGDPALGRTEAELARRLGALRNCAGASCLQGPALELQTAGEASCTRTVGVAGLDTPFVDYVDFVVDGRAIARDGATPFELRLAPAATAQAKLRAVAVLDDGRRLTLDRTLAVCS